ncbi:MAG: D-threonine aldolase [Chloroflexota bacterium]|nr:D-threonine aldolase [Chloroflexota bacterium]
MRDPAPMITEAHDRVRELYGSAIGRDRHDVVTPALVIDRGILVENLAYMESRLPELHARLRGHVKNHKSPHVARLQLEHGAFGICAATVWEAIVMVRAGADDVLIANQLVDPAKRRAAALLAREANVIVNVDDAGDAEALSDAAVAAGSTLGVLVEVDTGMHRAGADTPEEALAVARRVQELAGLRMDGLSGYEGHCSMEMDHDRRHEKQAAAMDHLVGVADLLEANGIPCPILSAAGTATAFWTGANPRITELQLGSYAAMDDYHFLMEPRFKKATSAVVTVISRRRDRVVLNLGKKTFGAADVGNLPAYPRIVGHEDLPPYRFDEEHATYEADAGCTLKVGDVVDFHLGYTPFAVNYFDAYHVVDGGVVTDIWPILPRGPLHGGLLPMLEAGR